MNRPCRRYVKGPAYWEDVCLRCGAKKHEHHGFFARLFASLTQ